MLTTVEAEIDVNGKVKLLEPLNVKRRTRAIVTLLEDNNGREKRKGNGHAVLDFLRNNRLPESSRLSADEIEDQIQEARNSWD